MIFPALVRATRRAPPCPSTVGAAKPGSWASSQLPIGSPRSSAAADQPDPRTKAASSPAMPNRSRIASPASLAAGRGSSAMACVVMTRTLGPARTRTSTRWSSKCDHDSVRSPAAGAGAGAQLGQVVVRRPRGLGGVGEDAQGQRARHAALEVVEHVDPGGLLAVQGGDPDPDLAVKACRGALPLVQGRLVGRGHVVEGYEDLLSGLLHQSRQCAVPALAPEGDPPAGQPTGAPQGRVRATESHLVRVQVAPVRRVQHDGRLSGPSPCGTDGTIVP